MRRLVSSQVQKAVQHERLKQNIAVYFYGDWCGCDPSMGWGVSDLRDKFEKLPEVLKRLKRAAWDGDVGRYRPKTDKDIHVAGYLNGAWYTFQELQKRIDEYEKLTASIRNEFNLWTDGREFADVIEAQIENLEALRGEHE